MPALSLYGLHLVEYHSTENKAIGLQNPVTLVIIKLVDLTECNLMADMSPGDS